MILNVVIIILETKFDCVIGTLQGKKKKVSSWDVISHTWPSYLVTLHPRGICWYLFVSPTRLLKYTHPSRRAVLMMPVSLPLSFCFLCVSWLSLSLLACICLGAVPGSFLSGQSNSTPETHPLNRALQYFKPGTSHRLMPSCSFLLCGTKLLLSSFPRVIVDLRVILTSWSQVFFLYLSDK